MLGIYISGHPLEKIKEQIKQLTNISSKELKEIDEQNSSGENDEGKVQEKLEYEDGQERSAADSDVAHVWLLTGVFERETSVHA